jgi:Family of unknown function (DUF5681)
MPSDGPGDDDVGYKKPPVASRFKKGNNANPCGRPRGSKVLAAVLKRALDEPAVDEPGRRPRQTKREQVIRRLVEKSAGADFAATKLLFELLRKADPEAVAADPADAAPLGQNALEMLKQRLARLARAQRSNPIPAAAAGPDAADPPPAPIALPDAAAPDPAPAPYPTIPDGSE